MKIDGRLSFQVFLCVIAALLTASSAAALPSQEVDTIVRHATEPTTGTMVVAALLVLAHRAAACETITPRHTLGFPASVVIVLSSISVTHATGPVKNTRHSACGADEVPYGAWRAGGTASHRILWRLQCEQTNRSNSFT